MMIETPVARIVVEGTAADAGSFINAIQLPHERIGVVAAAVNRR
jgi:hypothetical protein